jgi:pimeloyl-ACP methyl ester carboxylesterase
MSYTPLALQAVPSRRAWLQHALLLSGLRGANHAFSAALALETLLLTRTASAAPDSEAASSLDEFDLKLSGDRTIAREARVLIPRGLSEMNKEVPVLVLLHGQGEVGNPALGLKAWPVLYGLKDAYERLMKPPVTRTLPKLNYFEEQHLKRVNAELSQQPFRAPILVCPVTPRPSAHKSPERVLDRYADWLEQVLLPEVNNRFPASGRVGLDGCSMGGYVATEVFLRRPHLFSSFGTVQSAISVARAKAYAPRFRDALAQHGLRPLHFETSSQDPFREATQALSMALSDLKLPHTLEVLPGPHNQPWLREVGTLTLLLWHSRALFG